MFVFIPILEDRKAVFFPICRDRHREKRERSFFFACRRSLHLSKGFEMKLRLYSEERTFNRATRKSEVREHLSGDVALSGAVVEGLRNAASLYRMSMAEVVSLALSYYFGDGADHLACDRCDFWLGCCRAPEEGEQTTLPLLDKGRVVVGLSTSD